MIRRQYFAALLFACGVYGGLHALKIVDLVSCDIERREIMLDEVWHYRLYRSK